MVERVRLSRAPTTVADAEAIADWLRGRIDADVTVHGRLLERLRDDELARDFAATRVRSPYDRETGSDMLGIVRYEERALASPDRAGGVLYDGLAVQQALNERLPSGESIAETLDVALLDRVLGTWGGDGRWHKRVSVLGRPALISVPGLYEAPAKPEEYYKVKQSRALLAGDAPPREVLEKQVEGSFLVEDDPRTTAALQGYVLQAVHLLETGEAFCDDDRCRLFNAHHQEDLIRAQLRDPEFCPRHASRYGDG